MDPQRSQISNGLGISVLGLLSGLAALCFLADYFTTKDATYRTAENETTSSVEPGNLSAQLAEVIATRDALQRDLDSMTRGRVDVDGEVNRQKKEMTALNQDLIVTKSAAESAASQLAAQQNRIDDFDRERARLTAELEVARAGGYGDSSRLKAEYDSYRRKAESDLKAWEIAKAQLEATAKNLNQQNEVLKSSLSSGLSRTLPHASSVSTISAMMETENQVLNLKEKIVLLEQKLDSLGNQRNELARALRAAHLNAIGANNAAAR